MLQSVESPLVGLSPLIPEEAGQYASSCRSNAKGGDNRPELPTQSPQASAPLNHLSRHYKENFIDVQADGTNDLIGIVHISCEFTCYSRQLSYIGRQLRRMSFILRFCNHKQCMMRRGNV
jgi:hypothetical protein